MIAADGSVEMGLRLRDFPSPQAGCDFLMSAWGREEKARKKRKICVRPLYTFLTLLYTLLREETQISTLLFFLQKRGPFSKCASPHGVHASPQFLPQLLVGLRCHVSSEGVALWLDWDEPQGCPVISYSRCVSAM